MKLYPSSITASDNPYGSFFQHFRAKDDDDNSVFGQVVPEWSFDDGGTGLIMSYQKGRHKMFPLVFGNDLSEGIATVTATLNGETATATINIGGGDVPDKNHLDHVTVSPSTASTTAGSSFNQVFTITPSPEDDGSYTYSWNSVSDGLTITKNGATATVSGIPTSAGSVTVSGFAKDSYGTQHGASATITVEAAAPAHINKIVSVTLPDNTAVVGQAYDSGIPVVVCDPVDDGTYTYWFDFQDGAAACGWNKTDNLNQTTGEVIGTATAAGTVHTYMKVTDSYGKVAEFDNITITVTN